MCLSLLLLQYGGLLEGRVEHLLLAAELLLHGLTLHCTHPIEFFLLLAEESVQILIKLFFDRRSDRAHEFGRMLALFLTTTVIFDALLAIRNILLLHERIHH